MWFPTQDEAVEIYARFLTAHYGKAAGQHARETADKLLGEGDFAGYAIWSRVADAVHHRDKVESALGSPETSRWLREMSAFGPKRT
jgi:hypothetical protein